MALKAKLTKLLYDALPDALKTEYKPSGDAFILDVVEVEGFALENATGLRSALATERSQKENAEKLVAKFKDLDPDLGKAVDMARAAYEENKVFKNERSTDKDKVAAQVKSIEEQLVTKYNAEKSALENTVRSYHSQLEDALIESRVVSILQKHKGIPELLLPSIRNQAKMEADKNGKFYVKVTDKDGNARITKKADQGTNPMDLEELVEELKSSPVYSRAFEPTNASGSGANSGNRAGGSGNGQFTMSRQETQADYQKYKTMSQEAAKVGQSVNITE